ncbi:MAG: PEGA domain-containing protein [Myxococcales bacterium]|nr:PEGA domain-containing protein [Myxococcales bacterium]
MNRAVVAAALVGTWVGTADAGSGRSVQVQSDPPGATVYLNEKEAGPVCAATPCSIEAPPGEQTIIIELKDHQSKFEMVVVPRRGRVPGIKVKLDPAVGTIVIDGPPGASVMVDDLDKGKAPARIDVSEESHHVVVTLNGKTLFDEFVEVTTGNETTVTPKQVATGGGGDGDGEGSGDGGDGGGNGGGDGITRPSVPAKKRDRFILASAAVDVGFRQFTYSGVETAQTLRDEKEGGQVLAGPLVEIWPGELIGIDPLRGLSLLARLQFGVNSQDVTGNGIMDKTNTFWQSMEISLRYRHRFAEKFTAEAGIGYVRDQFQFEGNAQDVELVPDVDYQSVRLGIRGSMLLGALEPYVQLENRVVTSGGKLATRFDRADPSGYRVGAGINARKGALLARLEASLTNYSWDITAAAGADKIATGATDSIQQIQIAVGYQY